MGEAMAEVSGEDLGDGGEPPGSGAHPRGVLVLAATPLGNPADASARLRTELATADVVAAEDTRRLKRLCQSLGVVPAGRVLSYHDHNEATRTGELIAGLLAGARTLVVTDAGMPSVSDPGYRLVTAALQAGVPVTCVPGPSAVTTALALSGLPVDRFCFEGFAPRRPAQRRRAFAELAAEPRTLVFFEAPHRVAATVADLAEAFGAQRPAALCRELTKTYEEVRRGTLGELARALAEAPARGEITLVVAGADTSRVSEVDALSAVRRLVADGVRLKDACRQVATASDLSSRELYALALADPAPGPDPQPDPQPDPDRPLRPADPGEL
ncbi:MAG: 16S rRNA (cytidine(1402)-2'-O)-methyltransferase [Austwickia sp.]|nr:16S rRNA (cytidine(1402)-2'-O)-methyltransferase [Austwickia sp.]MBK8436206.1 16S rRNA (cytidine(1402)-2'-O)-methyltransferase [Austwickia sp.]MBK9101887.1 16S rRNA (cytidine(1402)-2'-O)-methyltransferase [Austwickia sp.]